VSSLWSLLWVVKRYDEVEVRVNIHVTIVSRDIDVDL
jgi:hypothetical protein